MRYRTLTFTVLHGVATIVLDHADRMNALNAEMRAELAEVLTLAPAQARALSTSARAGLLRRAGSGRRAPL